MWASMQKENLCEYRFSICSDFRQRAKENCTRTLLWGTFDTTVGMKYPNISLTNNNEFLWQTDFGIKYNISQLTVSAKLNYPSSWSSQ